MGKKFLSHDQEEEHVLCPTSLGVFVNNLKKLNANIFVPRMHSGTVYMLALSLLYTIRKHDE